MSLQPLEGFRIEHVGCHAAILDAHVRCDRRANQTCHGGIPQLASIHHASELREALDVLDEQFVVDPPELLEACTPPLILDRAQRTDDSRGLLRERRNPPRGECVGVDAHLFRGGDDDLDHGGPSKETVRLHTRSSYPKSAPVSVLGQLALVSNCAAARRCGPGSPWSALMWDGRKPPPACPAPR